MKETKDTFRTDGMDPVWKREPPWRGWGLRLELLGCELDDITTVAPPTTPLISTPPMTTFGATTTAPITVPVTTATMTTTTVCEEGRDCGTTTDTPEDYDSMTVGGTTLIDSIIPDDLIQAYVWFACNFDFSSFCGWTSEGGRGAEWLIQTSGTPTVHKGPALDHTGGPGNFIYMQLSDTDMPSKPGEDESEEDRVARLSSLKVTAPDSDLCMSFWYHMFGEHAGKLHIKQRKETPDSEQILWMLSGHQGGRWREGRVLLPRAAASYQVVVEGVADRRSSGHIAVDTIQILDGLNPADCKDPEAPSTPPTEILILPMDSLSQETSELGSPVLKTLDPILITIIAMSALGVFLGAICGVVLYCACSQGSITDRNLSALENYNFELVDGVKLKKDKMNGQTNYSEA
ncbi:neuropilin-1a-like [Sphaeramia orbicularis]|uniref:neuropilin-1a-like n=1 Tax=Sphaeramia orbicularis TaxID=375764 RepID=UPI00117C3316|nr:neuropilin-1a-like [Sphaeramia orbicularis]